MPRRPDHAPIKSDHAFLNHARKLIDQGERPADVADTLGVGAVASEIGIAHDHGAIGGDAIGIGLCTAKERKLSTRRQASLCTGSS
jgi:hypothetical protein